MLVHSSFTTASRGLFCISLAMLLFLAVPALGQTPSAQTETPPNSDSRPTAVTRPQPPKTGSRSTYSNASQESSTKGGHPADTNRGRIPHGSNDGAVIGAAIGAAATGLIIAKLIHNTSPGKLGHDGPQVPKEFNMNAFVITGLVHPSWPVVLDFMIESPGSARIEIIAGKRRFRATITNKANRRGYAIVRLPSDFGTKLQTATYQIRSLPAAAGKTPPKLRIYGLGAGEKAVGSVAIDQLTFQPATIHPKANEAADYGFHAHSAFDGVRAEFIFTTLYNGRLLVQKDQEEKLSPIPEGERAKGKWKGQGKSGEHMLQIRAWRGLENGGDWVVAWSPDIVDVVK
jgi:hypothetical protein